MYKNTPTPHHPFLPISRLLAWQQGTMKHGSRFHGLLLFLLLVITMLSVYTTRASRLPSRPKIGNKLDLKSSPSIYICSYIGRDGALFFFLLVALTSSLLVGVQDARVDDLTLLGHAEEKHSWEVNIYGCKSSFFCLMTSFFMLATFPIIYYCGIV